MSNIKKAVIEFYLDWFNNFISVNSMAQYYNISEYECNQLIIIGRKWHNEQVDLQAVKSPDTTM